MENLYQLYHQLNVKKEFITRITSQTDSFYYRKPQPKRKFGKDQENQDGTKRYRDLLPPAYPLKLIQKKICNLLQKIQLPECMYGAVEDSNNIINALQHIENKFFLTIDLKDFFSRITNKQVHHVFMENGFPWEVSRILTKLTTYKGSLPQGAPSSPVLANLAFAGTARQLEAFSKGHDLTVTIFLDDLVFSSKKDFKYLGPQILSMIRNSGFFPHNKKIHYRKNTCEITGLIAGNSKLRLIAEMQKEALHHPRIKGYAKSVEEHYQAYLTSKERN